MEGGGFEPPKVEDRQIYSLLPLATWLPLQEGLPLIQFLWPRLDFVAGGGIRTRDLLITNQVLYQLSYTGKVPNCLRKPGHPPVDGRPPLATGDSSSQGDPKIRSRTSLQQNLDLTSLTRDFVQQHARRHRRIEAGDLTHGGNSHFVVGVTEHAFANASAFGADDDR